MTESLIGSGPVLLDLEDNGVARLRLNRPEAGNGMSVEMLKSFKAAVTAIAAEPRVRCVLLSGEGKIFCGGGDVKDFASKGEDLPNYLREATALLGEVAIGLIRLDAPVVAIVHGFAAGGGGLGLVAASDLVISAESTKFMSAATRVAMAPDAGSTATLSRMVGFRRAMELVLGGKIIKAPEALEWGLVNRVVPDTELEAAGLELANRLAAGAPRAQAEAKRLMWTGMASSVEQVLPDEARTVSVLSGSADSREGLAAVIEKRDPQFTGD